MFIITKNISEDQIQIIIDYEEDPRGAWKALKAEHNGSSNQDIATLLMELGMVRLQENPSLEGIKNHFNKMTNLRAKIAATDKTRRPDDIDFATKVLLSLPSEFEQIKYARLSGPTADLTFTRIKSEVEALVKRRTVINEGNENTILDTAAMVSRPKQRPQDNRSAGTRIKGNCWNCNKPGHRSQDCRSKKKDKKNNDEANNRAAIALMAVSYTAKTDVPSTTKNGMRHWVIDNAATCGHVSRHKGHFEKQTMFNENERPTIGGIGSSKEARISVFGKGDVVLVRPGGQKITLKDVNFAPDAAVNLFSVRTALQALSKAKMDGAFSESLRSCKLVDKHGKVIVTGAESGGLKYIDLHTIQPYFR
jgi:hypothetical protein